jgi:hypothetical protein
MSMRKLFAHFVFIEVHENDIGSDPDHFAPRDKKFAVSPETPEIFSRSRDDQRLDFAAFRVNLKVAHISKASAVVDAHHLAVAQTGKSHTLRSP